MAQANDKEWAKGLHISMSGLIGAGKSTLAADLAHKLNLPLYQEKVSDNQCLEKFYTDQERYGFLLQISLLTQRLNDQHKLAWSESGGVQDRSIYEDIVFCRMLHESGKMSDLEFETYLKHWKTVSTQLPIPDIIVHLQVSPKECMWRIAERGRDMEGGITLDYLTRLNSEYERFLEEISKKIFVISIDWSVFKSTDKVIAAIKKVWENAGNLHHISVRE